MTGRLATHVPAWLLDFISRYKRAVFIALALGVVAFGCTALLMFTSGYLISATAQVGMTLFAIMTPIACVQLFGVGRPFARYLERLVSHDWVLRITSDLRLKLFGAVRERLSDPASAKATGEYLAMIADDIGHLQNMYLRVVFPCVIAILLAVVASIAFGFFSMPFALVMLLVFTCDVVALPLCTLLATRMRAAYVKSARDAAYAQVTDDVMGARDWVLAGRGDDAVRSLSKADDAARRAGAWIRQVERAITLASKLFLGAVVCGVVAWAAGLFGQPGSNPNWIAAFALGFFPLIDVFSLVPQAVSQATDHVHAIRNLDSYLAEANGNEASGDDAAEQGRFDSQQVATRGDGQDMQADARCNTDNREDVDAEPDGLAENGGEGFDAALAMTCVSYSYPSAGSPALDRFSVSIPVGQRVAILGRSGAGKSTLANIVRMVLRPQQGEVCVMGKPASSYGEGISSAIGHLGQSPYLFNRTLRENLNMGAPQATDGQLVDALERVGLGERYRTMPDGLDTVIGETGEGFSGGEAHRIALARVILMNVPILLVDEPFAALDPATERSLLNTLFEVAEGRTLVVITHHLAQIERFDRVVFLEEGHITLDGSPESLKAQSPYFRMLLDFDRTFTGNGPVFSEL